MDGACPTLDPKMELEKHLDPLAPDSSADAAAEPPCDEGTEGPAAAGWLRDGGTEGQSARRDGCEMGISHQGMSHQDAQEIQPARVVEAILFASDSPLPPARVAAILGVGDARDVRKHIKELNEQYAAAGLSFRIEEIAGGFQMMTLPAYNTWLAKLLRAKEETKLSPAAMETMAIVAYKQPVTRADIEAIRGVAAGDMLQRLRELNLVKIVGRAEDLGRPLLYGTTKRFLEVFGLPSLEDLPQVEVLKRPEALDADAASRTDAGDRRTETRIHPLAPGSAAGSAAGHPPDVRRPEENQITESPDADIATEGPQLRIANDE